MARRAEKRREAGGAGKGMMHRHEDVQVREFEDLRTNLSGNQVKADWAAASGSSCRPRTTASRFLPAGRQIGRFSRRTWFGGRATWKSDDADGECVRYGALVGTGGR